MTDNKEHSPGKFKGSFSISIICFFVFSLGFLPVIIGGAYVLIFIPFNQIWHFLLIPFMIYVGILVTLFYQLLFTGLVIHIFNIKYEPGVYEYTYDNKMAYRWSVVSSLYSPIRKLIEMFPVGRMKVTYLRMLGMKIGDNCLIGGTIKDPCLTEFGDNVTMGEYAIIYGHIQNMEKTTLIMDRIKIGDNCVIGAGAIIMPGAVLKKNVKLAAGALVAKGQILKKGRVYGGVPAKVIKKKK
jgi:acetyltransferase-like isoleucine patch superfamily enzyme